jgi:hypothetical protein
MINKKKSQLEIFLSIIAEEVEKLNSHCDNYWC